MNVFKYSSHEPFLHKLLEDTLRITKVNRVNLTRALAVRIYLAVGLWLKQI